MRSTPEATLTPPAALTSAPPSRAVARGRLYLEVSTLCRWSGRPVGIARVQYALAAWARAERPDIALVVYCPLRRGFRRLSRRGLGLLEWGRALDLTQLPRPLAAEHAAPRGRLADLLHGPRLWRDKPRWQAFQLLGRLRRRLGPGGLGGLAGRLQGALVREAARPKYYDAAGPRRQEPYVPAMGPAVTLRPGDTLVLSGMEWTSHDVESLAALKRQQGFDLALLCHDLIPLTHPQWVGDEATAFRRYMHGVLPLCERLLFLSRSVAEDSLRYCAAQGLGVGQALVVPAAREAIPAPAGGALPAGLRPGGYALFVSTLEIRKNHALLVAAWQRLRARGLPQAADFKLVFVGKPGWMVDPLLARLADGSLAAEGVVWLQDLDDAGLAALYRGSAFCLFPSHYEGFGLPITEAFAYGKAVIASTGGALPEVVGGLSPCLDPGDLDAWEALLGQWIADPAARRPHEEAIARGFRPVGAAEAGAAFFAAAAGEGGVAVSSVRRPG